jgi:hypothetical protein
MAMVRKPYGGVYENMDFANIYGPYSFQEYPKHVPIGPDGKYAIANSREEEDAIVARLNLLDNLPPEPAPLVSDPEKEILISRARELGVPINTKWSKQKIKATIATIEEDVDELPVEEANVGEQEVYQSPQHAAVVSASTEKSALLAEARSVGVYDSHMHVWGVPRLKAAIAEAKAKENK